MKLPGNAAPRAAVLENAILIQRPISDVFAFCVDLRNETAWHAA